MEENKVYLRSVKPGKRIILFVVGLVWLLASVRSFIYFLYAIGTFNYIYDLKEIIKFIVYFLIGCFYISLFYKNNIPSLLVRKIKKHGKMHVGTVLHVNLRQVQNMKKFNRELLIEYIENGKKKYIVDYKFPYKIILNDDYDKFDPGVEQKQYNNEDNSIIIMDKERIEKGKESEYRFLKYSGNDNKNFDKSIFCKVYEYNGLYTIDEYVGDGLIQPDDFYDRNKIKSTKKEKMQITFDIVSIVICMCVHFLSFLFI